MLPTSTQKGSRCSAQHMQPQEVSNRRDENKNNLAVGGAIWPHTTQVGLGDGKSVCKCKWNNEDISFFPAKPFIFWFTSGCFTSGWTPTWMWRHAGKRGGVSWQSVPDAFLWPPADADKHTACMSCPVVYKRSMSCESSVMCNMCKSSRCKNTSRYDLQKNKK